MYFLVLQTHIGAALPCAANRWILRGRGGFDLADLGGTTSSFSFRMRRIPEPFRYTSRQLPGNACPRRHVALALRLKKRD